MRENFSLEILREKKRYDSRSPNGRSHEKSLAKCKNGERKPVLILVPGSHKRLASRKCIMCARNMGAHVQCGIWSTKGIKTGREIGFPCSQQRRKETTV